MKKQTSTMTRRDEIIGALTRLDRLLGSALTALDVAHADQAGDRFRGPGAGLDDPRRLLARTPGAPAFIREEDAGVLWPDAPGTFARRLSSTFGLSQFDLDVLLIAFAPEFDLRYERLYAYLQEDMTATRPTVDLVLNLLVDAKVDRWAGRAAFDESSAPRRHELIALLDPPHHASAPLLARIVVPDDHLIRLLHGHTSLDDRLARFCELEQTGSTIGDVAVSADIRVGLETIAETIRHHERAALWLTGRAGAGKRAAAGAVATAAGMPLLVVDATRLLTADADAMLRRAARDAATRPALLYIAGAEALLADARALHALAGVLHDPLCSIVVGSTEEMPVSLRGSSIHLALPMPHRSTAAACWRRALAAHHIDLPADTATSLAARFRLTPGQIASAASDAVQRSRWLAAVAPVAAPPSVTPADLFSAARAQSSRALDAVATKIVPRATWDDIVLPADAIAQLRELCQRVDQRGRVFDDWGFGRTLSRGRGTTALFSGVSGTGKTMAAEVLARALGLDLYRVDLAAIAGEDIGETEKNLDRIFDAAESANAILLFDEADALLGRPSDVDVHDRYADVEMTYLLQKMEEFDGLAILATHAADHLDPAFTSRLAAVVHFPFPDAAARLEIWKRAWPGQVPIADDVDLAAIARDLKLAGGNIRNIALAAAFSAAGNGGVVNLAHVVHAVEREHQKSDPDAAH